MRRLGSLNWPSSVSDGIHFGVHLALPVAWGAAAVLLPSMVQEKNPLLCGYETDYLPDWWLLPVGILALLGGRFISVLNAPPKDPGSGRRPSAKAKEAQVALVALFALLAAVWYIEALGTAHVSAAVGELDPITWYTRCAIYHDRAASTFQIGPWSHIGPWTFLVAVTACFTAGHWLWSYHPDLRSRGGAGGRRPGEAMLT